MGDDRASRLCAQTHTLSEFLIARDYEPKLHAHALVHGHCHHKSVLDFGAERRLLANMGLEVEFPDSGCCGLAGSFGYEREHYDISMAIGERVLLPAVRAQRDTSLLIARHALQVNTRLQPRPSSSQRHEDDALPPSATWTSGSPTIS